MNRVIEGRIRQVRAVADAAGRETERFIGLEQAARQLHETVAAMTRRQGAGASSGGERLESKSCVGKAGSHAAITIITASNSGAFDTSSWPEQKATDPTVPERTENRKTNPPTIVPETSNGPGAARLAHHLYTSVLMCTEAGTETHAIVDNTQLENGLEA